jgi:hypothetical protein
VPAVEVCVHEVFIIRYAILVKDFVMRVFECDVSETFVGIDEAISDDLDLWLVRDSR